MPRFFSERGWGDGISGLRQGDRAQTEGTGIVEFMQGVNSGEVPEFKRNSNRAVQRLAAVF